MQRAFDLIVERLETKKTELYEITAKCNVTQEVRNINHGYVVAMSHAIEIVNQVASEYGDGWIPVSSGKLPEDNKPVLCWVRSTTIASGETFIIGSCSNNKFWFLQTYEIGHHHFPVKDYEVVAWCELPEPYKVESEE